MEKIKQELCEMFFKLLRKIESLWLELELLVLGFQVHDGIFNINLTLSAFWLGHNRILKFQSWKLISRRISRTFWHFGKICGDLIVRKLKHKHFHVGKHQVSIIVSS